MKSEDLLERAKREFDRTDIVLEMFDKEDNSWSELTGEVYLDIGVELRIKVVAKKVYLRRYCVLPFMVYRAIYSEACVPLGHNQ